MKTIEQEWKEFQERTGLNSMPPSPQILMLIRTAFLSGALSTLKVLTLSCEHDGNEEHVVSFLDKSWSLIIPEIEGMKR